MEDRNEIYFRWLGVAGIELRVGEQTLIIDPYFTRAPFYRMWFGKVIPESELIRKHIKICDDILVTHPHIDHLMDVPEVISNTGCRAYGSANTCKILEYCGVDRKNITRVKVGDRLELGDFRVTVMRARHRSVIGFGYSVIKKKLSPPLNARQYRMDECFSYHIRATGISLLTDPGVDNIAKNLKRADILFTSVTYTEKYCRTLFGSIRPKLLIPIHWDNFFYPINTPLKPYYMPPSKKAPYLRKIDLGQYLEDIKSMDPEMDVLIPEIFKVYGLKALLGR